MKKFTIEIEGETGVENLVIEADSKDDAARKVFEYIKAIEQRPLVLSYQEEGKTIHAFCGGVLTWSPRVSCTNGCKF